jgi:hypothetical protein
MLVIARPRIEFAQTITCEFPDGLTLADYVRAADLDGELWQHGVIFMDEAFAHPYLPEVWHLVRPKPGNVVRVLPLQSGKSLSKIFKVLIPIAQIGLQSFLPGFGGLVASAALGIGANYLLSKTQPKPKNNNNNTPSSTRQLGQSGFAVNQLKAWEQIPTLHGRKRVAAAPLVPPWVELDGDVALVKGCIGLAGRTRVSDILVNGAEYASVNDLLLNIREGDETDGDLTICTKTVWQRQGKELSRHSSKPDPNSDQRWVLVDNAAYAGPQEAKFRIGDSPDRVILDFLFPQGLGRTDGGTDRVGMALRLVLYPEDGGPGIVLPELHPRANFLNSLRCKVTIAWTADPGGLTAPGASNIWRNAFASTSGMTLENTTADAYFGAAAAALHVGVDVNGKAALTIYLDPAQIPKKKYVLGIKAGAGYRDDRFNRTNDTYAFNGTPQSFAGHFSVFLTVGPPAINRAMEDQAKLQTQIVLEYISSEWDEAPFDPAGLCTVEFQGRNIQIDSLTFLGERYYQNKWNGSAWVTAPHTSSNPATIAYDILTDQALNKRALPGSLKDAAQWGEAFEFCRDSNLEANILIESGDVDEALDPVLEAGHLVMRRSETWGVYIDKDRSAEAPVQLYSPRNSRDFHVEKTFDNLPHGFSIAFDDEDDDYQTKEIVVYADGYSSANATDVVARKYAAITLENAIRARAKIDLRTLRQRNKTYSIETNAQYLISSRGKVVRISTDVLSGQAGFARIKTVYRQDVGGVTKIVAIECDDELRMVAAADNIYDIPDIYAEPDIYSIGEPTGIVLQARDGAEVVAQTGQSGKRRFVKFTTPLDDDDQILPGCHVISGPVTSQTRKYLITDVKPGADITARLTLIDLAPEIFA